MGTRPHVHVSSRDMDIEPVPRPDWAHPYLPDPNISARNGGFTGEIRCYWPLGASKEDVVDRLNLVWAEALRQIDEEFAD